MQIVVNKRSENGKSGQIHPKMNILEIPSMKMQIFGYGIRNF